MEIQKLIPEAFLLRSVSLEPLGLRELAWTRSDALELLAQLANRDVAVLGGDVYSYYSGHLKPSYENWSCERRSGEDLAAYTKRSQQAATSFIHSYPDLSGSLFSFVLSEEETAAL